MKTDRRSLKGSTLAEMLVLMILTGIIGMSVFDGFSLFERLLSRMQGKLEASIGKMESYQRLDHLFATSDSIKGTAGHLQFFRQGVVDSEIIIEDSLLIALREEVSDDTLWRSISSAEIISHTGQSDWIDSLMLMSDTTRLRFGIVYNTNLVAERELLKLEKTYDRED